MAAILFKAEHHWKTKRHWQTEQRVTKRIQEALCIPAPTVVWYSNPCLVPILRKLNSSWMAADLSHLLSVDKIKQKYNEQGSALAPKVSKEWMNERLREWESKCSTVRENCVNGSVQRSYRAIPTVLLNRFPFAGFRIVTSRWGSYHHHSLIRGQDANGSTSDPRNGGFGLGIFRNPLRRTPVWAVLWKITDK